MFSLRGVAGRVPIQGRDGSPNRNFRPGSIPKIPAPRGPALPSLSSPACREPCPVRTGNISRSSPGAEPFPTVDRNLLHASRRDEPGEFPRYVVPFRFFFSAGALFPLACVRRRPALRKPEGRAGRNSSRSIPPRDSCASVARGHVAKPWTRMPVPWKSAS